MKDIEEFMSVNLIEPRRSVYLIFSKYLFSLFSNVYNILKISLICHVDFLSLNPAGYTTILLSTYLILKLENIRTTNFGETKYQKNISTFYHNRKSQFRFDYNFRKFVNIPEGLRVI